MIVSVADSGVLELFWRHPVSRNPSRAGTVDFLARLRQRSRQLGGRVRSGTADDTIDRLAAAISSGECVVLQYRSETRWHGTRMPLEPISSSVLVLSKARTNATRDLSQALRWLTGAEPDDLESLWKVLWVGYSRASAADLPSWSDLSAEAERLIKAGDLVPVFHPLPVMVATVVQEPGPAAPPAPSPTPPPPDPATFEPDHLAAVQTRTLERAAEAGVPFCEICEKLAASQAKKTWIEIVLIDFDKKPVAGKAYEIELPDGSVVSGVTDANGKARYDDIPAGQCKVRFPEIDGSEWAPVQ
jgi:hypothetical protein